VDRMWDKYRTGAGRERFEIGQKDKIKYVGC
jgi:hypothetical protein